MLNHTIQYNTIRVSRALNIPCVLVGLEFIRHAFSILRKNKLTNFYMNKGVSF